ncbi:class I fructose-bisphosphate aldolase, partial [Micrococcus luteus]
LVRVVLPSHPLDSRFPSIVLESACPRSGVKRHPRVIRVLALSGGYTRAQATTLLARNHGVIASFSRALTEGLSTAQSPAQFNAVLDEAINAIATASRT